VLLRSRKTLFIFTIVFTLIFGLNFAWAQGDTIQIQKLEIEILPEYDTADILAINAIEFKNISDQDFTGELTWRAPKGSKTHIITTDDQPDNHLQFAVAAEENFDKLTWKLPKPLKPGETQSIHLEYYYNNLQGAPDKTFSFEFTPDYPVSAAEVYVIQPITATNFKLTPEFGQAHQSDKFTFFVKKFFVSPDNGIKIEGSYTKTDPNPSVSGQQMPAGEQQGGAQGAPNNTVKILLALGIGAFIALLIYKEIRNRNTREDARNYDEDDYENEESEHEEDLEDDKEVEDPAQDEEDQEEDQEDQEDDEPQNSLAAEKRKLEEAFKDGRISESDYLEMLSEIEEQEV